MKIGRLNYSKTTKYVASRCAGEYFQLGPVYIAFAWEFIWILYQISYINRMIHQVLPSFYWIFSHWVLQTICKISFPFLIQPSGLQPWPSEQFLATLLFVIFTVCSAENMLAS